MSARHELNSPVPARCQPLRDDTPLGLRAGFTLMELLLVLALLVVMAAIAWPAMRGPLERMRVTDAGRTLRAELARARLAAIDQGQAMAFRFEPGGRGLHYAPHGVLPLEELNVTGMEAETAGGSERPLPKTPPIVELPERVTFIDPARESAGDGFQQQMAQMATSLETAQVNTSESDPSGEIESRAWSTPLVFYPDGVSEDQTFQLESDTGWMVEVRLRGLTGSVTVSPVTRVEVTDEFGGGPATAAPSADAGGEMSP